MERPVETQPSLSVWVNGEVWSYMRTGTRIYSFGGVEINVWDHAAGKPGIEFTPEAVEARVKEWLKDEEEADADEPDEYPPVNCRAGASTECYHGRPSSEVYDDGQEDDGTWNGESVVCDPCYIALGFLPVASDPSTIENPHRRRESTPRGMTDEEWSIERFGYHGENA